MNEKEKNALSTNDLRNRIRSISRICSDFHIGSLQPQIAAFNEVLGENKIINVALVGRFKSGKSSFLNSLIGKDVLPVGILPLTAIITRIKYGIEDKVEVKFFDGRTKNVTIADLSDYIAEDRNPENEKKVDRVDLELSVLQDYPNIQFVDTPGLGSAHQHNTVTSKNWLPRVSAAFLAISIDHPLSEEDIELLKDLEKHTPEVNILLTKIDIVTSEELEKVIGFVSAQIRQRLNKEVRIFPFSNRPGHEVARSAVFGFIQGSIGARQADKLNKIVLYKLGVISAECHRYLSLGLSAARADQEACRLLIRQLGQERELLPAIHNEIRVISDNLKACLREEAINTFENLRPRVLKIMRDQLKEHIHDWKGNLKKIAEVFWRWEKDSLLANLTPISGEYGSKISEHYMRAAVDSCSRVARAFQDRLAEEIEKALHVQFPGALFEVNVPDPEIPDVYLGPPFITSLQVFWFLIPMSVFRPLVNRAFFRRLSWDVELNLGRLASQWVESLLISIENVAQQANAFIEREIVTIENLVSTAPDHLHEIEKAITEIKNSGAMSANE